MLDLAGDGVDEQVVDAGPVTVDGGLGDPGAPADLIDGETGHAFGDEQREGGVREPFVVCHESSCRPFWRVWEYSYGTVAFQQCFAPDERIC